MSRDHTRLRVFGLADTLVIGVYRESARLPVAERFGLQSQIRRAAVSVATNLVEGCARTTTRDYVHFLTMSLGSANEVRYLIDLSHRLGLLDVPGKDTLSPTCGELVRGLQKMVTTLSAGNNQPPRRELRSREP